MLGRLLQTVIVVLDYFLEEEEARDNVSMHSLFIINDFICLLHRVLVAAVEVLVLPEADLLTIL